MRCGLLRNRAVLTRSLGQEHIGVSASQSGPEVQVVFCNDEQQQSVSVSG